MVDDSKSFVAVGSNFTLALSGSPQSGSWYLISDGTNSKDVMFHAALLSTSDVERVYDSIDGSVCSRILACAGNRKPLNVTPEMVETFDGLVANSVPSHLALSAALMLGPYSEPMGNAVSLIQETGAPIQVDNKVAESTIEIFVRGASLIGVTAMQKIFHTFGSSILDQRRGLELAFSIPAESVESFETVPNESLVALSNYLSHANHTLASEAMVEAVADTDATMWPFIGELSMKITESDFVQVAEMLKVPVDLIEESYREFYSMGAREGRHDVSAGMQFHGREADVFALLLVNYGITNIVYTSDNLRSVAKAADRRMSHLTHAQYLAVITHISRYEDPNASASLVLNIAGLPEIGDSFSTPVVI